MFSWVCKMAPSFHLSGNKIEIIEGPREFHEKLKELSLKSKKRILLGSLYLGISPLEQELVDSIKDALRESDKTDNGKLRVTVVLDYMRASRGFKNSRTMLLSLINHHSSPSSTLPSSSSLNLYLFHTPDLRGWLKKCLPERFNEVVGLFHIKAYIFDDHIIISGSNLSETYFSSRQDRYVLIKNFKPLADFYHQLFDIISKYSFSVGSDDSLHYGDVPHPYSETNKKFRENMKGEVEELIHSYMIAYNNNNTGNYHNDDNDIDNNNDERSHNETDTVIYPLIQMGPMNVTQDEKLTTKLLTHFPKNSRVYLASGYFNITDEYIDIIIRSSSSFFHILTAAPQANSFYKSAGLSGSIPPAYTYIASRFLEQVKNSQQTSRIKMYEYNRPNWTVHSKGVWLYPPSDQNGPDLPYLTLVGSSNYGYRSVKRDLESQLLIITNNKNLQMKLHQASQKLCIQDSYELTADVLKEDDRKVPYWVTLVAPRVKTFF
ncbi:hypothetical protein HELRODRAFT_71229 [Helobdella robusta]|uniref:CDP-diacylglycerol--glycerol-3-phosphate 3-phosphatidyltransferase n=1 Tax=Helobdella robusta TaxID=6412 RepID=T1G0I1_HELRO|nr:hypothetical protein HELRODRAFT_71229 [Helobdella robusta]ESN90719.1 hypothetical protein HELRODRAFT_71229 [Helobdella robusta]